ncbi:MAG TPA: UbiA family prenyltransferase [Nocardioidaceae bacterium]|jgi:4-hydroxybenzoate polyprenyltransferase
MTASSAPTEAAVPARRLGLAVRRLSLARLAWDMLRWRVALTMWLFMLLAAAYHGVQDWPLDRLLALSLALGASYVVATTVNDIADVDIDRVNRLGGRGRPLVTGDATRAELYRLNVVAALVALAFGSYVGWRGVAVVAASLVVAYVYSVPPLRISHRMLLTAPVLTLAYVAAPYLHGLALAGVLPSTADLAFAGGLCCLFCSRILLKDFRDRAGDAAHGKPTLALRFGKPVTCAIAFVALVVGSVLVASALKAPLPAVAVVGFGGCVGRQLWALVRAPDHRSEQVAIGIGARMGNGLLICLLAWLLLEAQGAAAATTCGVVTVIGLLYAATYVTLVRHPDEVLVGYKG